MNNYYYSQQFNGYKDEVIPPGITMGQAGCAITVCAMLISYFNDRPLYPDDFLHWLHKHNGLTKGGRLYWSKVCEAAGGKLRMNTRPNPKPYEVTYGVRECLVNDRQHFVLDHPASAGKIIDPWDGQVKNFNSQRYTGKNMFFMGKKIKNKWPKY